MVAGRGREFATGRAVPQLLQARVTEAQVSKISTKVQLWTPFCKGGNQRQKIIDADFQRVDANAPA